MYNAEVNTTYRYVILEKIASSHNRLRDDRIDGISPTIPKVGECFYMGSSPKDVTADMRLVRTSPVKEVASERKGSVTIYAFKTENSTYRLTAWDFFG